MSVRRFLNFFPLKAAYLGNLAHSVNPFDKSHLIGWLRMREQSEKPSCVAQGHQDSRKRFDAGQQ
jgi:hypothetical protein